VKKNRVKIIVVILFIIGSIWALLPTYTQWDTRSKLENASAKDSAALASELKGEQSKVIRPIKLGLDLRGGVYVTMEVDVAKFIEEQATQKDELFNQVMAATRDEEKNSQEPVVSIFVKRFKEIAAPKGKMLANYFVLSDAKGDDASIQASLEKGADEAVNRAMEIIRNRVDQYGLTEPTISKFGSRRIIIELPGVGDPTQIHQLIGGTAQLEFKLMKDPKIVMQVINRIDQALASSAPATAVKDTTAKSDSSKAMAAAAPAPVKGDSAKATASNDTAAKAATASVSSEDSAHRADSIAYAGLTPEQKEAKLKKEKPFSYLLLRQPSQNGQAFFVTEEDRNQIMQILNRDDIKGLYADEVSFCFSRPMPTQNGGNVYMAYFLNSTPELTGKVITDAGTDVSQQDGRPEVSMQMDDDGARDWKRITTQNVGRQIAIVLDNVVYSAPVVNGPIPNGRSSITGSGDMAEANLLKIILKSGALPAPVKIIQEQVVGPSLGADSISKGTWSVVLGFLAVIVFMALYYRTGGGVADLAVLINLLFTLAILATFGATLTLPGMAGLVLTVGIAVDANVLIYERIREELDLGKSLKLAIDDGYRRAFAPIWDGHLTAFISGVILYAFGTGTIQGFAVTLMIGIAVSLFTAIVITKIVFDIMLEKAPNAIKFG